MGDYTQSFGSDALDVSALMTAIVGLHPGSEPRLAATIDAVAAGLSDETGLLSRSRGDDGFASEEGTFLLCTFWLVNAAQALADATARRPAVRG